MARGGEKTKMGEGGLGKGKNESTKKSIQKKYVKGARFRLGG